MDRGDKSGRCLQIKGRCLASELQAWTAARLHRCEEGLGPVLLVLLDENFDAFEMHEAERAAVLEALSATGSKARNERGQLGVSKFKSIGRLRWRRADLFGLICHCLTLSIILTMWSIWVVDTLVGHGTTFACGTATISFLLDRNLPGAGCARGRLETLVSRRVRGSWLVSADVELRG